MDSTVFACDVSLKTVDSLGTVRRTSYERMIGGRSLVQCDRVPGIAEFEYGVRVLRAPLLRGSVSRKAGELKSLHGPCVGILIGAR